MPTTTAKGFSVQAAASNAGTWGAGASHSLNEGVIELMDTMLGGVKPISLSASNVLLSTADAQNGMLRCTGTLSASVSVSPDAGVLMVGFYYWENLTTGSYTVTISNGAGSVVLPQGRRGALWIDTTDGPRIVSIVGSSTADPVPAGTVITCYNSAAPAGYTVVSLNDYALKVVSASGGVASGSVAYSTLFARTATDSYTLTTNDIPSHTHDTALPGTGLQQVTTSGAGLYAFKALTGTITSAATGGGAGHSHGIDMRVQTAAVLLCTRN